MKFNVEMDKRELKKFLNKPNHWVLFCNRTGRALKKINWKSKFVPLIVIFLFVAVTIISINMAKDAGYQEGYSRAKASFEYQQDKQTTEYFEDATLEDTASWFAKKALIVLGTNLHILFLVIALAWILHGVGFRII